MHIPTKFEVDPMNGSGLRAGANQKLHRPPVTLTFDLDYWKVNQNNLPGTDNNCVKYEVWIPNWYKSATPPSELKWKILPKIEKSADRDQNFKRCLDFLVVYFYQVWR